jgi:hypothetical protein
MPSKIYVITQEIEEMTTAIATPGRKFFDTHLEAIAAGKIDEMVDRDYAEDAVLTTFFNGFSDRTAPFTVKGRPAIKEFFHRYMSLIGNIDVKTLDFTETESAIFFQATFTSNLGLATVGDAWYMQNGKIAYHFGFWV